MVRWETILSLAKMGPKAEKAVKKIIEKLEENKHTIRTAAIWALGEIGHAATEAIEPLKRLLTQYADKHDDAEFIKKKINEALQKIG